MAVWTQDELDEIRKKCEELNITFVDIANELNISRQTVAFRFKKPDSENDAIIEKAIELITIKKINKKKLMRKLRA